MVMLFRFSCSGSGNNNYSQVGLALGELSFTDQNQPMLLCGVDIVGFEQGSKSLPCTLVNIGKLIPISDGSRPFVFAYISAEKRPRRRSAPPNGKSWIRPCLCINVMQ